MPGLFPNQEDSDFNQVRPGADNDYWAFKLDWNHQLNLPKKFLISNTVSFQYSFDNLISNEQLSITGAAGVRGYESGVYSNADNGILIKTDFFFPPVKFFGFDQWRFLAFFDFASFGAKDNNLIVPNDLTIGSETVTSTGLGLRLNLGQWLNVTSDYGFQLNDVQNDGDRDERWHVAINAQW